MPSDLTERLAAKLREKQGGCSCGGCAAAVREVSRFAPTILPLLLSEPELVAGLPEAVRLGVLNKREFAVMRLGEACVWRAQVITDPEAMYNEKLVSAARVNVEDALADARALTTEGKE